MTPVHHSLSMKSGSIPMKVIHISAIFAQAKVDSRSLKVQYVCWTLPFKIARKMLVVVVLRSPIHANEPSEYNGMLYRTSNRVLNNGIKVIILICMDGTSQYHHHQNVKVILWTVTLVLEVVYWIKELQLDTFSP